MSCSVSASNSSNAVESACPWRKASSFLICSVKTKVSGIIRPPISCKYEGHRYATVGFVWQVDRPWRAGYPGHDGRSPPDRVVQPVESPGGADTRTGHRGERPVTIRRFLAVAIAPFLLLAAPAWAQKQAAP